VKGLSALWRELIGAPSQVVLQRARLADLVVIERPGHSRHDTSVITEAVLFESGRPVLCVPGGSFETLPNRMAVLWNGSAQAARAVGDALPLLVRAETAAVISIEERRDRDGPTAAELVDRLKLNGANAAARTLQHSPHDAVALFNAAFEFGAELIVMGAFGHSRLRELMLGGVTRHMLSHSAVPVLMAR
jgi:nucleotide-binding universal stress UspA family protein